MPVDCIADFEAERQPGKQKFKNESEELTIEKV